MFKGILRFHRFFLISLILMTCLFCTFLIESCKDKDESKDRIFPDETGMLFGSFYSSFEPTVAYTTSDGEVIRAGISDYNLTIILSDTLHSSYTLTDSLFVTDQGKARCSVLMESIFLHPVRGTVEYDRLTRRGSFTLFFNDSSSATGKIRTDTVIFSSINDFSTLTRRDNNGYPMSEPDSADWTYHKKWPTLEAMLFYMERPYTNEYHGKVMAWPNPFNKYIYFEFPFSPPTMLDLILVNQNYEIMNVQRNLQSPTFVLACEGPSYTNTFYRLYYRQHQDDYTLYGYGDIKVE